MAKTGQQIEDDIYALVKDSSLPSLISGTVYKFGMRPKDAKTEDAIVKFVTGLAGQIQDGVIVVNIYVPDFDAYNDGIMRKDITAEKSDYKFKLAQTIYTAEEPELNQHFVSVRLKFELTTF